MVATSNKQQRESIITQQKDIHPEIHGRLKTLCQHKKLRTDLCSVFTDSITHRRSSINIYQFDLPV